MRDDLGGRHWKPHSGQETISSLNSGRDVALLRELLELSDFSSFSFAFSFLSVISSKSESCFSSSLGGSGALTEEVGRDPIKILSNGSLAFNSALVGIFSPDPALTGGDCSCFSLFSLFSICLSFSLIL